MGVIGRLVLLVASVALAGCGVAATAVGTASQAALAPVAEIVREANMGLRTIDHTASTIAASSKTTARTVEQTARAARKYQAAVRRQPPPKPARPLKLTRRQKQAIAKSKKATQPDIVVLPEATLATLSEDQRGLQTAAQKAALTAPVGEVIFWDDNGRSGSASTSEESKLGTTICRTFEHEVTIDGAKAEGRAHACLDTETGLWQTAF
jgi:surface antigen